MKLSSMRLVVVFLLLIGVAGAGVKLFYTPGAEEEKFVTATVDRATIQQFVSASGTVNPVKLVNVGTQVSGVVYKLHADFNDAVKKGQVLAELDPSLLNAQLQQSK